MTGNARAEDLKYIAGQLGYVRGYGENYIQTYGNLADNEAAYLLQNIDSGNKGSIAYNDDTGFFAHWIDKQSREKVYSPYFQDREKFLDYLLKNSSLQLKL